MNWAKGDFETGSSDAMLAGSPLCSSTERFFGVVWTIKGDLDWFAKGLGLRHYGSNQPCDFCKVNKKGPANMWPTNFAKRAPWKSAMTTFEEWRGALSDRHCVLFKELEYLSMHNIEPDELHIVHLGVSRYLLGSVLWLLTYSVFGGLA